LCTRGIVVIGSSPGGVEAVSSLAGQLPGEWFTIELVKQAVRLLTSEMRYEVPEQDLTTSLSRMPAIPRSRLVIRSVVGA
jgi:NADH dehydrogenase FAD-containing subunit